jgi:membrane peptidoglycan carboxypeptidase
MRRLAKAVVIAPALLLLGLVAFESFAVVRAKQRTPQVLQEASAGELKLADIPAERRAMLLRIEDPAFYEHHGVDFSTPGAGMTTITQALVKRFYFEHFEKGFPKIEQTLIARFVLDPAMAKDAQLTAYLNHSYFGRADGRTVIGFADAARSYFHKPLAKLSDQQFLALVAMLIGPNELDPIRHSAANAERVRRIEALLAGQCAAVGLRDVTYQACAKTAG